jgi:hypothetical protein
MNKEMLLTSIANEVQKKHPWKISQEKYIALFGELPKEFLNERLIYDNLLEKTKQHKICQLILSTVKIEIKLSLYECISWELNLDKWAGAKAHNITPNDIKKILKQNNFMSDID